ncbi:hypothetical protein CXG81DRAFT_18646 [Caulochytrium protostelioides]|uniref:MARVEL domain-containing protein n=1 Tax=Caulochytrium protostelioides TaxID=1555241 RepID=A0A4P9X8K8_9FUNG|nr:hypothetical protein CXG81DRAFT_18646 [Caulochytrium protostelioides]|eukprot:RKP01595.1 hypothetical protein CXG81DRAFT_18646 [Caulochytrium protostelioides]
MSAPSYPAAYPDAEAGVPHNPNAYPPAQPQMTSNVPPAPGAPPPPQQAGAKHHVSSGGFMSGIHDAGSRRSRWLHTLLRALILFFAIITLGCAASFRKRLAFGSNSAYHRLSYTLFVSASELILSLVLLALLLFRPSVLGSGIARLAVFVIAAIWAIFWLAAGASLADLECYGSCGKLHAATAFSFLAFVPTLVITYLAFRAWRHVA